MTVFSCDISLLLIRFNLRSRGGEQDSTPAVLAIWNLSIVTSATRRRWTVDDPQRDAFSAPQVKRNDARDAGVIDVGQAPAKAHVVDVTFDAPSKVETVRPATRLVASDGSDQRNRNVMSGPFLQ